MFANSLTKIIISTLVIAVSSTVFASPRNINSTIHKQDAKTAEQISVEEAYRALLKIKVKTKQKAAHKPRLVKASFYSSSKEEGTFSNRLHVTATAYTSHVGQTDSTPNIAAWGDRLRPGMKAIAVSRDLLKVYGLKHGQKVRIKGLKGEYAVLDKMNKRWRKKIDIYMGMNKRKAFKWGRRKVEIMWNS